MAMLDSSPRSSNLTIEPTMADMVPRRTWPDFPDVPRTLSVRDAETFVNASLSAEEQTDLPPSHYEMAVVQKPRDVSLQGVDRLVQDLLATQTLLEDEKRKVVEKDAEIARLEEQISQLLDRTKKHGQKSNTTETKEHQFEPINAWQLAPDEEVNELRRLLAFHKTNGEGVSRQCQELQATNKELQASLQATEKALEEQAALISGLGLQPNRRSSYAEALRGHQHEVT